MNWWLIMNVTDPAQELQWLIDTLQLAENNHEKVCYWNWSCISCFDPVELPDGGGAMCLFEVLKVAVILANKQDKLTMNIVIIYFNCQ